ncbi:hypothetical protein PCCS19_00510 [Paenibacillus sp. CCS19]|nr:hypothetical protein PCCS19_00510 [Paenibacillus cellulosilyticus]
MLLLDPRLTAAEKAERERMFRPEAAVRVMRGDVSLAFGTFIPVVESALMNVSLDEKIVDAPADRQDALTQFSSGSTGIPKMIVRSKRSLLAELADYATEQHAPASDSVVLCLVPLCHSFGLLSAAAHTLGQGGTLVFPEMLKPSLMMQTIIAQQVSHLYGVAFHYQLLAGEWDKYTDIDTSSWRSDLRLLSSGGPFPEPLLHSMLGRGLPVGQQYGMSEVGYIAVQWAGLPTGSVGSVASRLQAEVTDEGELVLVLEQSPYRCEQAQWEPDAAVEAGGRLFTQDAVTIDELGRLYIGKRMNDQLSIGGLKLSLSEIEQELSAHPSIQDCCVVSYEQPLIGTVLEAFVVRSGEADLTETEIKEWLASRLARYKIPRRIRYIDEIPVSPAGKIMRGALLKEYCHEPAAAN